MFVFVAATELVVHDDPAGPHLTLATVPPVVLVAQLTLTEVWIESVRYGYRVRDGSTAALAPPPWNAPTITATRTR
jgi:hypothetical protein